MLSLDDRDTVIRTIYGEARDQKEEGMVAVAYVIHNRQLDKRWPDNATDVVKQKWQFSSWNENDPNYKKIKDLETDSVPYALIGKIVDQVWKNEIDDPTEKSVYYYAPKVVSEPSWWKKATEEADGKVIEIGDHIFTGKISSA